ncbi:hypothetical protein DSLASN_30580 [Desulfoluna limicola]|uniref:G domain-containing protein n=1 Tax=Desulfoluna limicola TaxID=2810562 RepID=A0ABN6F6W5_9BACT|nr:hypothetical protein [Desulfoluna limicola]BCS97426.1 hypothetical protein DSLASN_30580 [Desulfoluna limicola]
MQKDIDIESPNKIYADVRRIVHDIIEKLEGESEDSQLQNARKESRVFLNEIHGQISEALESLEEYAEWDTFTIAFYGETNAGKSTIIEALRVALKEQSKQEEHRKFTEWQTRTGITEELIDSVRQSILNAKQQLIELEEKFHIEQDRYQSKKQPLENQLIEIERAIRAKKKDASFWRKLLWFCHPMEEQRTFRKLVRKLRSNKSDEERHKKEYHLEKTKLTKDLDKGESLHCMLERQIKDTAPKADGTIIGDGSPDFTRETRNYRFDSGSHPFAILDVPGIEGNESEVVAEVWAAVKKSHAVFYVTSKPSVPEPGTLEKIKNHLGSQTEVWTIFNKPINNPMQLETGNLVSQSELASLNVLGEEMKKQLGESYQGRIELSAYPAFLSVSECLLPGSIDQKNKRKFLKKNTTDELGKKTHFEPFAMRLGSSMVADYREKIETSNKKKVKGVLERTLRQIIDLRTVKFSPLVETLEEELRTTQNAIDSTTLHLHNCLKKKGRSLVDEFKQKTRKAVYKQIDHDICNDMFKSILRDNISNNQAFLEDALTLTMSKELEHFEEILSKIVQRFQEKTEDLFDVYEGFSNGKFELNIQLESGIDVKGVLLSLIGGALLIWSPAGWLVLVPGVLSIVVQLYKAFRSVLSSSYKKSQQKKATDENLSKISRSLSDNLQDSLNKVLPVIDSKMKELKSALGQSCQDVRDIEKMLVSSERELNTLNISLE